MKVNATQIITPFDKTEYTTNEDISAVILGLEPILLCDEISILNAVPDFIIPTSDVYMTPASNVLGIVPHSDLKGLSKPNEGYPRVVGGSDPDSEEIIAGSKDVKGGPGNHYVIFDHCQDGRFTPTEDEIVEDPVFNVIGAAEDLPNLEKLRLKASASQKLLGYERSLLNMKIVVGGILMTIISIVLHRIGTNPVAGLIGELSTGGALGAPIAQLFTGLISGYANLIEKNKRIAQDPPDFNYQTLNSISQLINPDFNPDNPLQFNFIPTIIQYTYDLKNEAALTEGLLHSIEKYDGAILNGDQLGLLFMPMK